MLLLHLQSQEGVKGQENLKSKFYFNNHLCVNFFSRKATLGLPLSVCPCKKKNWDPIAALSPTCVEL